MADDKNKSRSGEDPSLKSREYRDKDGNVHHHTKKYQEQHGQSGGESKGRGRKEN